MNLLIDQGNTRLKACLDGASLQPIANVSSVLELEGYLHAHSPSIHAVAFSSVASIEAVAQLESCLLGALPSAILYRAIYSARLLPTQYLDASRLGIDRWLAMLAVKTNAAAVIVDAGTAFTVDVLQAGQHQGGYILPGLRLQRDALASETAAVSFPQAELSEMSIGCHTAACVGHGSLRSLTALVSSVVAELAAYEAVVTYLTGGDANVFMPHVTAVYRPLLVFEGLQLALADFLNRSDQ